MLRSTSVRAAIRAAIIAAAVSAACDESFEATAPTDLAFSVFGYLDASADTQWVRVMPLRSVMVTTRDPLAASVTLEHLGTGRIVELRDSVFRFSSYSDSGIGAEGAYVHNFWTAEPIEPGAVYRFTASLEGKDPAEAVVEIPGDYDVEVAIQQFPSYWDNTDELRVYGLVHLPFLTTTTHYYDDCGSSITRNRAAGRSADDGVHLITITKPQVIARPSCGRLMAERWDVTIVGSGAAWPAGEGYAAGGLGETSLTSNVTNGVGFIGGVLTKVIPYEECEFRDDGAPVPFYCVLRYNPETATVSGTVSETRCGDGPIDSVTVQMTELDRDPARIRPVLSTRSGEFLIGALEPGIPHALWVRAPLIPTDSVFDVRQFRYVYIAWKDSHTLHTDTLTFLPGQRMEYDIGLERLTSCGEPPPRAQ